MSTPETIDERAQLAAFDLQVELATRVGVQPLAADAGSLREALASLYSIFTTTREVLRGYGPATSAVHPIAEDLLVTLHEFLSHWHPRLAAWEQARPAEISAWEHERRWAHADELRAGLRGLGVPLQRIVQRLSTVSGAELGATRDRRAGDR